jgi:hypothetical protein
MPFFFLCSRTPFLPPPLIPLSQPLPARPQRPDRYRLPSPSDHHKQSPTTTYNHHASRPLLITTTTHPPTHPLTNQPTNPPIHPSTHLSTNQPTCISTTMAHPGESVTLAGVDCSAEAVAEASRRHPSINFTVVDVLFNPSGLAAAASAAHVIAVDING